MSTDLLDTTDLRWHPFARFNLSRNPFGELTRTQRIAAAVVDTDRWVDWLCEADHAVQFVGDCGHGKSTHMLSLVSCFRDAAYVYLPEDERCPELPVGSPLFVDEAQRLPFWRRRDAFRRRVPLVLGTHRDLTRPLERAGYTVQTFDVSGEVDTARLQAILNRRVEIARLRPGTVPYLAIEEAAELFLRFGTNIRAIEHYLYERFQTCTGDKRAEVRFID